MPIPVSRRMKDFSPGIFAELAEKKLALKAAGRNVTDLSVGSPDLRPSRAVMESLAEASLQPENYAYSLGDLPELKQAACSWYKKRYGVSLEPCQVVSLYGSQDALVHALFAFTDPGDKVLIPDPYYPAVMTGVKLAGCVPVYTPLREENAFLPDFSGISDRDARDAKVIVASYPNNPTTAVAPDSFFSDLIAFALKYDLLIIYDNAYSDITFDGIPGRSLLEFDGASEAGIELNSLSKTYSVPGVRGAFALGNKEAVEKIALLKSNLDLGSFIPTQKAVITALSGDQSDVAVSREIYRNRRDVMTRALAGTGLLPVHSEGTPFLWIKLPADYPDDRAFVFRLLEKTGVILSPGSAFGREGAGYVRAALMQNETVLTEAAESIKGCGILQH